jgi:hypothetical protein
MVGKANPFVDHAQKLFNILGFISHPLMFDSVFENVSFRNNLSIQYKDALVSKFLRSSPDLLVLNRAAPPESSSFFVVILQGNDFLDPGLIEIFTDYYPKACFFIRFVEVSNKFKASANWLYLYKKKELPLLTFLNGNHCCQITESVIASIDSLGLFIL